MCIKCPQPEPTEEARKNHVKGSVLLDVLVTAEGRTDEIVVLMAPGYGLDEKAIDAVSQWRFKPARDRNGKPIGAHMQLTVRFSSP